LSDPGETFVSVDIEAAGPHPGQYSLLAIGACLADDPAEGFYVELQPTSDDAIPSALAISGLSMDELRRSGHPPAEAMADFAGWVERLTPAGHVPVFVGFNAPFDWMFVNEYFHRHLGRNPFGHVAVDIKSYAMGRDGCSLHDTSLARLAERHGGTPSLTHHALDDARVQADLFNRVRSR
jgi:DNA polymerase III epsilon subunit-like protein